jgi:DNA-binding XRE family transcriptional regulator
VTTPARSALMIRWGRAISAARKACGATQVAAASHLNVEVWTLRAWEQGRRACPLDVRRRIVSQMGGDPHELDTDTDHCPECGRSFAETSHSTRPTVRSHGIEPKPVA